MIPAWVLPTTVMLDEAQHSDEAMVAKMRRELWTVYNLLAGMEPAEVRAWLHDPELLAEVEQKLRLGRDEDRVGHILELLHGGLTLHDRGLTPDAVTFAPATHPDGRRGCWVRF